MSFASRTTVSRSGEKSPRNGSTSSAVHSLQSTLIGNFREIRALLQRFRTKCENFLCSSDCVAEREGFEPSIQVLARIWRHASRHVVASARLPPGPDWKYFPHPSHPLLILGVASRAAVRRRPLIFTDINSMEIQVARGHAGSLRSPRIFLATPDFAM